jgi:hypothetical protein
VGAWQRWLVAAALALAWGAAGCNYFKAAQPEAPTEAPFTPSYVTAEATLETIAEAVADKAVTIGLTAYLGAFAESTSVSTPAYYATFWSTDAASWVASGHTVPDWTIREEKNFYIKLANLQDAPYELQWAPDNDQPDDESNPDVFHWHRHYLLRTLDNAGNGISTQAIGFADLTIVRYPDGNWRIARWDDRLDPAADPNDPEQMTIGRRRLNTTQ